MSRNYDLLVSSRSDTNELWYGEVNLEVSSVDIESELFMRRGLRVTGSLSLEEGGDERVLSSTGATDIRCRLSLEERPNIGTVTSCLNRELPPGVYRLEVSNMPPDAYIRSASANGKDILSEGLRLDADTEIEIVVSTPGAIITGNVTGVSGDIPDAVVVLVPDEPYHATDGLYRSGISDVRGAFELRGVAPGSYRLYAWQELDGAAYRNAEFMARFEGRGIPVRVESSAGITINLPLIEE